MNTALRSAFEQYMVVNHGLQSVQKNDLSQQSTWGYYLYPEAKIAWSIWEMKELELADMRAQINALTLKYCPYETTLEVF